MLPRGVSNITSNILQYLKNNKKKKGKKKLIKEAMAMDLGVMSKMKDL